MSEWKLYRVRLIHKMHDWDVEFQFRAPDAEKAREWSFAKLAIPGAWVVSAITDLAPAGEG